MGRDRRNHKIAGLRNHNRSAATQRISRRTGWRSLKTEGQQKEYNSTALSIPYGVGVKVNCYKSWNLAFELGYRTAFTGYLDDVSGNYADKNSMTNAYSRIFADRSGEKTGVYLGATGSQRGDLRSRDTYMIAGFSLSFTFLSQKCYY